MTQNEANEAIQLIIRCLQPEWASILAKERALGHGSRICRGRSRNEAKRSQWNKLLDFSEIAPNRGKRSQSKFSLCFELFRSELGPIFAKRESNGPKPRIVTGVYDCDTKIQNAKLRSLEQKTRCLSTREKCTGTNPRGPLESTEVRKKEPKANPNKAKQTQLRAKLSPLDSAKPLEASKSKPKQTQIRRNL